MEIKKIQTPSYWAEEQYQPLVETKTAYRNPVKIPQRWLKNWEFQQSLMPKLEELGRDRLDGLKAIIETRNGQAEDLAKVLLESYQE